MHIRHMIEVTVGALGSLLLLLEEEVAMAFRR
jgi:hypothetical protein